MESLDKNIQAPDWMRLGKSKRSEVLFLDMRGLRLDPDDPDVRAKINERLRYMIEEIAPDGMSEPALIKTHIGEPTTWQRIIPELTLSSVEFLRGRGIDKIAVGDTTVLYSRGRGGKENTSENVEPYIKLAREHGWLDLGVPFVVLDRAISSAPGIYEFDKDGEDIPAGPPNRFPVVRVGGGVTAAGAIINHAHLTGHGLTGLALCVKGIGMGFADRRGKSQMHMAFGPVFDSNLCDRCGICATECPEGALEYPGENTPDLDIEKCIGCGQCASDCPSGAIKMKPRRIENWTVGQESINVRMADYFIGMMASRWDRTLHVAHLVKITEGCDCLGTVQKVMSPDIGFMVGKNPFAVDRAAQMLLEETAGNHPHAAKMIDMMNKSKVYPHIEKNHGLITAPSICAVEW